MPDVALGFHVLYLLPGISFGSFTDRENDCVNIPDFKAFSSEKRDFGRLDGGCVPEIF